METNMLLMSEASSVETSNISTKLLSVSPNRMEYQPQVCRKHHLGLYITTQTLTLNDLNMGYVDVRDVQVECSWGSSYWLTGAQNQQHLSSELHVSYSLNPSKGTIYASSMGAIKEDTRSLDHSSCRGLNI